MNTHMPGFQSFFVFILFLHYFVLAKLATSSIRVKYFGNYFCLCSMVIVCVFECTLNELLYVCRSVP